MICNNPYCGYVFPRGMQIVDTCPNCQKSPFSKWDEEEGKPYTYTKDFLEGKKIIERLAA